MIRRHTLKVTCSGSDGSATGNDTTKNVITGKILAVHLDYGTGQAATSDVVLSTAHTPTNTILTVTDNATDGWYYPRHQVDSAAGAGLTYDGTRTVNEPVPVCDHLKLSVAQGNDEKTVTATVLVEE